VFTTNARSATGNTSKRIEARAAIGRAREPSERSRKQHIARSQPLSRGRRSRGTCPQAGGSARPAHRLPDTGSSGASTESVQSGWWAECSYEAEHRCDSIVAVGQHCEGRHSETDHENKNRDLASIPIRAQGSSGARGPGVG
jgi:hypothetical protein